MARPAHERAGRSGCWIALILMLVGALNWVLAGAFNLDLVAALFGPMALFSRIVPILAGIAGLYGLAFLARLGRPTAG